MADVEKQAQGAPPGTERTVMVDVPMELGPYRLTELLGRGGMGEVWLATDTKLEREVAIKLMRKELLANEEAVKRFYREARAVARLNHPNIVQVYTFGEDHGVIYFVMELVEGETVTQRLKRTDGLPLNECVSVLLQSIEGLSYAHARGVIHRDIKPSNLMLTSDYRVKIADFGLAKMVEHDTQMTQAGTTMGSPNYMSPEQARGEEADHRSDIYALGISFYQMLMGELPFTAQTPLSVMLKQIQEALPEPESLREMQGGKVLEVLKRMTAKNPDERYHTYGGLAAAIHQLAPDVRLRPSSLTATASMPTPPTREERDAVALDEQNTMEAKAPVSPARQGLGRKQVLIPVVGGGILLLAGIAAGLLLLRDVEDEPSAEVRQPRRTPQVRVIATPAPTPQPSPVSETPAPVAIATPTFDITPVEPVLTPIPTATPVIYTAQFIEVGNSAAPVFDINRQQLASLPPGTRVGYLGAVTQGQESFFKVTYQNIEGYVRASDGKIVHSDGVATPPPSRPQVGSETLVLGSGVGGENEMVEIYSTAELKRKFHELKAGTRVPFVKELPTAFQIRLTDKNRDGYIPKGMGRRER